MKTSKEYDAMIAISIIRMMHGTHNVMDLRILKEHAATAINDKNIETALHKAHRKSTV